MQRAGGGTGGKVALRRKRCTEAVIAGIGSGDGSACAQLKYGAVKLHKALESKPVKLTDELTFKEPGFPISGSIRRDVH